MLRHADASHQKNNIGILRRQLMGARQEFECVHGLRLCEVNLRQQVKGFRRIGLQLNRAIEREIGLRVFASPEICLPQVIENFEGFRLQRVRLLQFELRRLVLPLGGDFASSPRQQHTEREVQLNVLFVFRGDLTGRSQCVGSPACLKVRAHQV